MIRTTEPGSDLLGESVIGVHDPRSPQPSHRPSQQPRPAVVCVDDVGGTELRKEANRPSEVELAGEGRYSSRDAERLECGGHRAALTDDADVDACRHDVRNERFQVGHRTAALEGRHVHGPHAAP